MSIWLKGDDALAAKLFDIRIDPKQHGGIANSAEPLLTRLGPRPNSVLQETEEDLHGHPALGKKSCQENIMPAPKCHFYGEVTAEGSNLWKYEACGHEQR